MKMPISVTRKTDEGGRIRLPKRMRFSNGRKTEKWMNTRQWQRLMKAIHYFG